MTYGESEFTGRIEEMKKYASDKLEAIIAIGLEVYEDLFENSVNIDKK